MKKGVVITGAVLILLSIILGAFGAHALKEMLSIEQLSSFETGVRYQMYSGLSILILGFNYHKFRKRNFKIFFTLILSGSILFSFSIYGLTWANHSMLTSIRSVLGPITPLGGLLMIIGWLILIIQLLTKEKES